MTEGPSPLNIVQGFIPDRSVNPGACLTYVSPSEDCIVSSALFLSFFLSFTVLGGKTRDKV